jgi:hypothetical protein
MRASRSSCRDPERARLGGLPSTRGARALNSLGWAAPFVFLMLHCGEAPSADSRGMAAALSPAVTVSASSPSLVPMLGSGELSAPAMRDGCRVMSVAGDVRSDSGEPLRKGGQLVGEQALTLPPESMLQLKHGVSAREWRIVGPARVLACLGGEEEIVLARGRLHSEAGAGVRPGAEVLIGTPFGSIHYADARADLVVSERQLQLTVSVGEAWLAPLDSEPGAEARVQSSRPVTRRPTRRASGVAALASCARAAAAAERQAQAVLQPSDEPLGQRAAAHLRARQRARASCASATASVLARAGADELVARLRELEHWRRVWQHVPSPKS